MTRPDEIQVEGVEIDWLVLFIFEILTGDDRLELDLGRDDDLPAFAGVSRRDHQLSHRNLVVHIFALLVT